MFMAQSSYEPFLSVNPNTSIISPHFCATYPIDLEVTRKVFTITDGDFEFTDVNGKFLFKEKGSFLSHNGRVQILDAAGNTIVTLRKKRLTMHKRWQVFRGDSSNSKDCIFNAKVSSLIQLKPKVDVFLAHNTSEKVCDFKVKGSWHERSCTIYAGESSTIVAQMHRNDSDESVLFGKDKFIVTVYPNVDYAFIVALVVILDEMNTTCDSQSSA